MVKLEKITVLMAQTLDGKIAHDSDHFPDWTSKADKKYFMQRTQTAGVLVMGRRTYATIGRPLPRRWNIIMSRTPEAVAGATLLTDSSPLPPWGETALLATALPPAQIAQRCAEAGATELVVGGGTEVNGVWLASDLLTDLELTLTPLCFGSGLGVWPAYWSVELTLTQHQALDDQTLLCHYQIVKAQDSRHSESA